MSDKRIGALQLTDEATKSMIQVLEIIGATRNREQLVHGISMILDDDAHYYDIYTHDSTLVEWGAPIEGSLLFARGVNPELRFAAEPLAYLALEERFAPTLKRCETILTRIGQSDKLPKLRSISQALSKGVEGGQEHGINWFMHLSLTIDTHMSLRVYFAPFRSSTGGNRQWCDRGRSQVPPFVGESEDFEMTVYERIIDVFRICGMDEHIEKLNKIRANLQENDKADEQFITFLGVDFKPNKPVSLKVYFNPQSRIRK